jgi:hypothetical protein
VGPVALRAVKQSVRDKSSKPWAHNKGKRQGGSARFALTAH